MSNTNLPSNTGSNSVNPIKSAGNIMSARNSALSATQYSNRITSTNPCAFVILIDQSYSMKDEIEDNRGGIKSKAEHLSLIVNQFLDEIILTCQKTEFIKDYFEILIIGYGKEDEDGNYKNIVEIAWEGKLKNKTWVSVNELRNGSIRKEIVTVPNPKKFGLREIQQEVNIWVEPTYGGNTPMKGAFELCYSFVEEWVGNNPNSFPPMVFNITDGEANDIEDYSELIEAADKIKSLETNDGKALLFNLLLSENSQNLKELPLFTERNIFEGNENEVTLFDMSSTIPNNLKKFIPSINNSIEDIKGVVFGNLETVLPFLNIGTYTLKNKI
ncbi:hypothetical protein B0A58_10280 [Flavobacterium branchiophilum NBRC 15030 = ATCC 35035]|uniref:VWFA domain-containing protein n=1 Tax=Flavobacterium branchiophilum TaxID=55197 RepID=A0A543G756_9FLAO|nr:hypothetical protein [Flavobacterium branchiophilum]OXA74695.1 hypothetical protein B0A58_10280 [Flavobacterium branchiophilum NBRC 15030 = ATCC 35035]TQM41917.1 hypothetical protein BC670_2932 [Flavobacterium branchiophilum]GEM55389.1 hypothetical protein FB1_16100 [Flavobacterium branchiophilum NBRC 15030 = ATCC 35035]